MNLLWLPAWYPNKLEPLSGDFIQRHARAVALYNKVRVIHVVRDKKGVLTKSVLEETVQQDGVAETIIYYYVPALPLAGRLLSALRYRQLYRKAIKRYLQEGRPDGVHVHVVHKNAVMALWLNRQYRIPFVVSEHWTAYLPDALPHFKSSSRFFKMMWRKAIMQAKGFTAVSHCLAKAITALQKDIHFLVIPNVVDDRLFFPAATVPAGPRPVQFIHVSTLGYQKNPEAIIEALALAKQTMPGFHLSVFGPYRPGLEQLAVAAGLQGHISFHAEVPQAELARYMRQADALILYSRYETFGCVLIEANASGIPAIVSDIPVHHETIREGENGYFATGNDARALAEKLTWFMQHYTKSDRNAIAATARETYSYENVGKRFNVFYENTLRD